jgi:hypothetical protein
MSCVRTLQCMKSEKLLIIISAGKKERDLERHRDFQECKNGQLH